MPMTGLSTTNAGTFDRSISEMPPELSEHPLWMSARHHFTNPLAALRSPKLFYAMEVNINGKANIVLWIQGEIGIGLYSFGPRISAS